MGLDTTHNCWHGAYSAFGRWRNKLAEVAGYAFYKTESGSVIPLVDWGHLQDNLYGEWDKTPEDPLLVLIAHSDCEGKIYQKEAQALADRLQSLLPLLPDEIGGGHIGNWRETTQTFIDGLRDAVARNEIVEFH